MSDVRTIKPFGPGEAENLRRACEHMVVRFGDACAQRAIAQDRADESFWARAVDRRLLAVQRLTVALARGYA